MKHLIITLLLISIYPSFSQNLQENPKDSETGLVYFLRGKGNAGSATAFSALIDENRVCKLNNRRFSAHELTPGKHEFKAQFGGKEGKKKAEIARIEIEAGKTYYIQMVMQASFWVNDVSAVEITRNSALRLMEEDKIKQDPNCGEQIQKTIVDDKPLVENQTEDKYDQLKKIKSLLDDGVLTLEEYEAEKKKILSK